MDEDDGRLGPQARKSGPADVLTDALAPSLRRNHSCHSITRPRLLPRCVSGQRLHSRGEMP
jgi:hypothetical protein